MKRLLLLLLLPTLAHAGGFEILEQSPAGVGTAGAQSAEVDDSSSIFYNPAKMTYVRGWSGMASINVINADTRAQPPGGGKESKSNITTVAPALYGVQRVGARFAIGLGGFANMAEIFEWPKDSPGRFLGYQINLTTLTFQPTVAFRPLPWFAIGVGIDLVPASFELKKALNFGAAEGDIHASGSTTGVGGNLGLFIRVVPRWLDFAFTYRSAIDLDFEGTAALTIPPELAGQAAAYQTAKTTITLPHNFTFGVGSHLAKHLSVDFDAHLVMWDVVKSLTLTLNDPKAPPGTPAITQGQQLDFQLSYGLRLGFEYRALEEKLRLRIGGGFEKSPVPNHAVTPLSPDSDRGLFGFGIGYHGAYMGIDVSYLLVALVNRTSTEPSFRATYDSMGHVVSIGISLHFEHFPKPLNEPDFKH